MGRRVAPMLAGGIAFGVAVAAIKGQDTGVRDAVGNTSAPWIVLPFLAGTRFRSLWRGALAGVAVTLAALLGFYVAESMILHLGPHPWYVDLRLTLVWNVYDTWGVFSGLAYGALGSLWSSRRRVAAAAAVGLAFVSEPLIVWLASRGGYWGGSGVLDYRWMWSAELILGLAAIAWALAVGARRPARPNPAA